MTPWAELRIEHYQAQVDAYQLCVENAGEYWMWWVNDPLETVRYGRAATLHDAKERAEQEAHDARQRKLAKQARERKA